MNETTAWHSALCPHETFSTLHACPELFEGLLTGPPGSLAEFWRQSARANSDWYDLHAVAQVKSAPESCVPIGIFGDDAGLFNSQKVFNPLVGVCLWRVDIDA